MSNQGLYTEYTRKKIKEIVIMIWLELYNQGQCCGAKAIKNKMEYDDIEPVPLESTIGRILSRNGLTHGRIGFYESKDFFPIYKGGQPPYPQLSLTHYRPKYEGVARKRPYMKVRPSYFGHLLGARVALQHSPILRKDKYKKHSTIEFASIIL